MSSEGKGSSIGLSRRYVAALRKQMQRKPGSSLRPAQRLGREALAAGLDTLQLAKIHEQALVKLSSPGSRSGNGDGTVARAADFFLEALTPIEKAHRVTLKANGAKQRKAAIRTRDVGLVATKRLLRRAIQRGKAAEEILRKRELRYAQLLESSSRMHEHLRRLSHKILSAQENERKRISRELHDDIGQTLTGVNVLLDTLRTQATLDAKDVKRKIAKTQRLVAQSMDAVHRFARELRPPLLDDLGLIPALHSYMKAFTKRTRIRVQFKAFAAVERLDNEKRTTLFRVTQEALTNIRKHAQASLVQVNIQRDKGDVRLEVIDNGKSFQVHRVLLARKVSRLGLLGMRERVEMVGGKFTVESAMGEGTTVRALIPFGNRARARAARPRR